MPVPAPFPLPLPAAAAPPPVLDEPKPAPPAKTLPCPRCLHENLEDARFCNSCGARMDARVEDISPAKAAEPAFDAFEHLDPMRSMPSYGDEPAFKPEPEPVSLPLPVPEGVRRPLQPGKMGQLADLEFAAPAFREEAAPQTPPPASIPLVPFSEPAPAAAVPVWKRPSVMAALAAVALIAAGVGYVSLNKPAAPVEAVATLTPEAPMPMPEPVVEPPKAPLLTTPPERSSLPPSTTARTRRTARKPRPKPVRAPVEETGGDTFIESRKNAKDPLLEALLTDASEPAAGEAAADELPAGEKAPPMIGQRPAVRPAEFALPGLKRPVSASGRADAPQARAPRPSSEEAAPPQESSGAPALAEPGKSSPTPGIEDEPVKSAEGDQLALVQVHEQFDFCAQLLAQGAFGDHYDTCLCREAREASPYRGRRGFYASSKKKEASAGRLETIAKILSSKIDGGSAQVTARWKASVNDKGRNSSQTWKLEDGLWCQAP